MFPLVYIPKHHIDRSGLQLPHHPSPAPVCAGYLFILFIYLLCHHTYTFIGWETTTAIADYSGPNSHVRNNLQGILNTHNKQYLNNCSITFV
jgi:hypothetical protein